MDYVNYRGFVQKKIKKLTNFDNRQEKYCLPNWLSMSSKALETEWQTTQVIDRMLNCVEESSQKSVTYLWICFEYKDIISSNYEKNSTWGFSVVDGPSVGGSVGIIADSKNKLFSFMIQSIDYTWNW